MAKKRARVEMKLKCSETPHCEGEGSGANQGGRSAEVKGVGGKEAAEQAALLSRSVRRAAALQALRENRHLFTAEAVIKRAGGLSSVGK